MRKLLSNFLLLLVICFVAALPVSSQAESCTNELQIDGAISTATYDFVSRALDRTDCGALLLNINTPGGSLQTTRLIVEKILAAQIPILCLVGPEGGHAGSAGALILLACNVSGAMPGTNVGAATPIMGNGESLKKDLNSDLRTKIVEDTKSWAISLAKMRSRSVEFAEKIVTIAKAYDAEAAVAAGGVDFVSKSKEEFLAQASKKLKIETGRLIEIKKDAREKFLSIIADPEFSYLLFMAALALLYFEITNAGSIAPGVAGALLLVTSLIAFQKLDVAWGGVGLIGLGSIFLVAEAFVPSFGALGIGGILAFAAGSLLLYDPASGGLSLTLWLSLGVPLTLGAALLALGILLFRSRRLGAESLSEAGIIGHVVRVERASDDGLSGSLTIRGEIWAFECSSAVAVGDLVRVVEMNGLKLKVVKNE